MRRTLRRVPPAEGVLKRMCIAFPGRVIGLDLRDATVEVDGGQRRASLRMRTDIRIGDWVLVGAGSVLRRLDPEEARELGSILKAARAATEARLAAIPPGVDR